MQWFYDLSKSEIEKSLQNLGLKSFVSTQLSTWVLNKNINNHKEWLNISKKNRELLIDNFSFSLNKIIGKDIDENGTGKFLIELDDGNKIESVLIKERSHFTFCISTQVGCALKCSFCATGHMGLKRDLSTGEIISQILLLKRDLGKYEGKINLVFMGMGEPLLNYKNLRKALYLITDEKGIGISPKRITVSTAGILKNLKRLEDDFPNVKISFSLNGSDNEQRGKIMPISKKEHIDDILAYFRSKRRKHRITFEYVLIDGINDDREDAKKVSSMLRGIPSKINIIPYNPNDFSNYKTPSKVKVDEFTEFLSEMGHTVMVRWSKGKNIKSACGQLAGGHGNYNVS